MFSRYKSVNLFQSALHNVAFEKPATQSSQRGRYPADKAVDGLADPTFDNGSCSHTLKQPVNWLRVDLLTPREVHSVRITNRRNGNGESRRITDCMSKMTELQCSVCTMSFSNRAFDSLDDFQ